MFPMKTMTSPKASKQTSAAASKIKNKVLNTSSFFKVSLKSNNRALAVALEAQKERSSLLQREVVQLQKQVEELCFQLAARNYKHRKLLLILSSATQLLDDQESQEPSDEHASGSGGVRCDITASRRLTDSQQVAPMSQSCPSGTNATIQSDVVGRRPTSTCQSPRKPTSTCQSPRRTTSTCQSPRRTTSTCESQRRPTSTCESQRRPTSTYAQETEFDRRSHATATIWSDASCSLRSQVEPQVEPQVELVSSALRPSDFNVASFLVLQVPQTRAQRAPPPADHERTVLLNTSMEMTVCGGAKIVTMETKAKKTGRKPRGRKGVKHDGVGAARRDAAGKDATGPSPAEVPEHLSPKTKSRRPAASRIPKLGCSVRTVPVPVPDQLQSCNAASFNMDDWFTDSRFICLSGAAADATERPSATITRRTSRTKVQRTVSPRTCESGADPPGDEAGGPAPEEVLLPEGGARRVEWCPSSESCFVNFSRRSRRARCRSTFMVRGGAAPDEASPHPHSISPLGKRARDATQDFHGGLEEDRRDQDYGAGVGAASGSKGQTCKKVRREAQKSHLRHGGPRAHRPPDFDQVCGLHPQADAQWTPDSPCDITDDLRRLYDSTPDDTRRTFTLRPAAERGTLRPTFVVHRRQTTSQTLCVSGSRPLAAPGGHTAGGRELGDLLTDELPPWLGVDEAPSLLTTPGRTETGATRPADRVLTALTNTVTPPAGGRSRRRHGAVDYKEPALNRKMRRGDLFSEDTFLISPVFKDGKKKKKKNTAAKL